MQFRNYHFSFQSTPVTFIVTAVVTDSDITLSQTEVELGYCTIHESVVTTIELTNKSCLPQDYGFIHLPKVSYYCMRGKFKGINYRLFSSVNSNPRNLTHTPTHTIIIKSVHVVRWLCTGTGNSNQSKVLQKLPNCIRGSLV